MPRFLTLAPAGTPSWVPTLTAPWLPVGACSAMDQAPGDICSLKSPLPLRLDTHDLPAWSSETARPISSPAENDSSRKHLGAGEAEVGVSQPSLTPSSPGLHRKHSYSLCAKYTHSHEHSRLPCLRASAHALPAPSCPHTELLAL